MNDKGNLNFLFACTISELSLVSCSILGFDLFDNQIIHVSSSVDGKMTILGINIGTILGPFDDWLWAAITLNCNSLVIGFKTFNVVGIISRWLG